MIIVFNDVGIDGRSHARAIRYFHVSEADVGAVPIHPDYKTATPEDLREHWQLMADWKATVREFLFEHHDFNSTMFDMKT